jgi:hypothetical protein
MLARHVNPNSLLTDPFDTFESVSESLPPGTKAETYPAGRERVTGQELPVTEPFEVFESESEFVPPGTKAEPRPPGKEREPMDAPPADVPALVARIEAAMETIAVALAEIKRLQPAPQNPPATQSKAG